MSQAKIDEQSHVATIERIARFTVGIAVERNTGVGTGTLISLGPERYIVTAAHVIGDSKPDTIRFWFRPPAPIQEKPAISTTNAEIGGYTAGIHLPIVEVGLDPATDIAILKLEASFCLPDGSDSFNVLKSLELMKWPEEKLDGLSLVLFGFPTDNSRPVHTIGNNTFHFLGCATHVSHYSVDLNRTAWSKLSSTVSPNKDFVFEYGLNSENIGPRGFSGSGVWVLASDPGNSIWKPDPLLIGVTHTHFAKYGLLAATKLSAILEMTPNSGVTP